MSQLPVPDTPSVDHAISVPHDAATQSVAVGTLVTTFMGWLPAILALLPAIYYCILIFESKTVQSLVARFRAWRRRRAIPPEL